MNMLFKTLITFLILLLFLNFYFYFKSNEIELQDPQNVSSRRIVAIGDLHGDYRQTIKVLHLAGVIDDNKNWTGGNGILIQTGDIADRGPDCLNIYKLFDQLRKEAESAGGMVINLFGNHEFMNLRLDWRYVTPEDIESFGSIENRIAEFSSNGFIGKLFRSSFQVTAIVEQDTIFLHGGINLQWANKGVDKIYQLGASLAEKLTDNLADRGRKNVTKEEISILEPNGPLWNRKFALDEDEKTEKELDKVLEVLKVKRMVIGHTCRRGKIRSKFNGKVYVIDVGISEYFGSNLAALEIIGDKVREIYPNNFLFSFF